MPTTKVATPKPKPKPQASGEQKQKRRGRALLVTPDMAQTILCRLEQGKTTVKKEQERLGLKAKGPLRRALLRLLDGSEERLTELLLRGTEPQQASTE